MMKLSIEEKAKAYDEALEKIKIWQEHLYDVGDKDYADELNYIFPELKEESEDERIKKEIISMSNTLGRKDWVAWLEKLGQIKSHISQHENKICLISKDERIRAQLMEFFSGYNTDEEWWGDITKKDILAWLEKQGTDISSFPKEQQEFMQKYVSLDKITLIKLLAERDANNAEIIKSFEKQCKQKLTEWSEEDEKMYKKIETAIDSYYAPFSRDAEEMLEWFKNFKDRVQPQSQWKPSDRQMNVLEYYMHNLVCNEHKEILFGLYTDLKKLREE